MIAVDTSSFIAYLQGDTAEDVNSIEEALINHTLIFPPVVFSEILSDGTLSDKLISTLMKLPLLPLQDDFWYRAGLLRAKLLSKKLKARLADTLIAQSCIDYDVPLITRDDDFRHFAKHGHLKLYKNNQ